MPACSPYYTLICPHLSTNLQAGGDYPPSIAQGAEQGRSNRKGAFGDRVKGTLQWSHPTLGINVDLKGIGLRYVG